MNETTNPQQQQNPGQQINPDPTVPQPKDPNPDQPISGTGGGKNQNQPSDPSGETKQPIGYNTNQREENGKPTGEENDDEDADITEDDNGDEEFDDEDQVTGDEEE